MKTNIIIRPYNGWSNQDTYLVQKWLHEDEMSLKMLKRYSKSRYVFVRARWLKDYFYELALDCDISLWQDMPKIGLLNVNWSEIIKRK